MNKFMKFALIFILVPFVMVSCKDDDNDNPTDEGSKFETLKTYLQDNNMDLTDMLDGWITTAANVNENLDGYYVMDIRSEEDFNNGHIEGAVHSSLGTIVQDAAAADKPIIVACYTGQTAGHAVMALRLSGYTDAKVLKFGMSSWHDDFAGPWNGNIGDAADGHTNWTMDTDEPTVDTYDYPSLTTDMTDGAAILEERVAVITSGFNGVVNTAVLDNPGNYYINNFWSEESWDHYGHIEGAKRIYPLSLDNIDSYDASKTVVTYCYTGQTSSMITAYLKMLGYDALSLKFGANGMVHTSMESHKWSPDAPAGFDYVTE